MNEFKSGFAPLIKEYLEFRKSMGFSNDHEKHLKRFDAYCAEHFPDDTALTKENVRGWYADEIRTSGNASRTRHRQYVCLQHTPAGMLMSCLQTVSLKHLSLHPISLRKMSLYDFIMRLIRFIMIKTPFFLKQ